MRSEAANVGMPTACAEMAGSTHVMPTALPADTTFCLKSMTHHVYAYTHQVAQV